MEYKNQKNSKYKKDLEELENLKEKAQLTKGVVKYSRSPIMFFRLVLTLSLLIIIFVIGFGIAYKKTRPEPNLQEIKYIPNAEILLPTYIPESVIE